MTLAEELPSVGVVLCGSREERFIPKQQTKKLTL